MEATLRPTELFTHLLHSAGQRWPLLILAIHIDLGDKSGLPTFTEFYRLARDGDFAGIDRLLSGG